MRTHEQNALRGMLGLCQRAGKMQSGADMAAAAIRAGKAHLALLDAGAADNTVKKISDACIYYHVPLLTLPQGLLGQAAGKDGRMAAAVTDAGFAARMQSMISGAEQNPAALHTENNK